MLIRKCALLNVYAEKILRKSGITQDRRVWREKMGKQGRGGNMGRNM